MLPQGRMFGRAILPDGTFQPLDSILVPGDDLHFWIPERGSALPSFAQRHAQLFGSGTTHRLRELSVAVVDALAPEARSSSNSLALASDGLLSSIRIESRRRNLKPHFSTPPVRMPI